MLTRFTNQAGARRSVYLYRGVAIESTGTAFIATVRGVWYAFRTLLDAQHAIDLERS